MMMMAAGEWLQRKWLFTNDKQNHKNGKEKAWVNIFIYNNGKFPELDSMICSLYSLKGLMIRCYKWAGEQQLLTVSQLRGDHRLQERDLGLVLLLADDAVLHQPRRQLVNAALLAEASAAREVVGVLGSVLDILCGVAIESILVPIIVDHIWKVTVMKKRFRIICIDILIHCIFVSIWTGAGKIWCCKNNNKFVVEMLNEKYFLYKCKNIVWYPPTQHGEPAAGLLEWLLADAGEGPGDRLVVGEGGFLRLRQWERVKAAAQGPGQRKVV